MVEVRFATEKEAIKHFTRILKSSDLALLPTCRVKKNIHIRNRKIPPEIK